MGIAAAILITIKLRYYMTRNERLELRAQQAKKRKQTEARQARRVKQKARALALAREQEQMAMRLLHKTKFAVVRGVCEWRCNDNLATLIRPRDTEPSH